MGSRRRKNKGGLERENTPASVKEQDRCANYLWIPVISASLVLATLLVYWPVFGHGFVNFDDPVYVTENLRVQGGFTLKNITWAFTTGHASNWHPLTWFSHMLDWCLFGSDAGAHHAMSVSLHIACTLLWFGLFLYMTGALWRSALVAALFALHPLHVESVAWVSERKDVLSCLFWVLATWGYVRYARMGGKGWYAAAFALLALGLAAKPMLVTLPFVFLLLDWWPLKRFSGGPDASGRRRAAALVMEKLPFFLLSVAASVITVYVQHRGGAVAEMHYFPLGMRLGIACAGYGAYIWKTFWPSGLAVIYPHFGKVPPAWQIILSLAAIIGFTVLALRSWKRRGYALTGWFWYLGTLVPVIGLVQVGAQIRADRYTYIPHIGFFVMVIWGLAEIAKGRKKVTRALAAVTLAALICFGVCTRIQVACWSDSIALFSHAATVTKNNYVAHCCLGAAYAEKGDHAKALAHNEESLRINPSYFQAHAGLGKALGKVGRTDEALAHLQKAVSLNPGDHKLWLDYGGLLFDAGDADGAIEQYRKALALDPGSVVARRCLGNAYARQKRYEEALREYRKVLLCLPENPDILNDMGVVFAGQKDLAAAIGHFQMAIRANPGHVAAYDDLGLALSLQGKFMEASRAFAEMVHLDPENARGRYRYARTLLELGKRDKALEQLDEALFLASQKPGSEDLAQEIQEVMQRAAEGLQP